MNVGRLLHTSPTTSIQIEPWRDPPPLDLPQKLTCAKTTHFRDGVGEEAIELFVGAVSHPTPPCRVKVLPDPSQANGHPLA